MISAFLIYFLPAFFLYAALYAGLGALVKRQDEVQRAVQVPGMLIISGWILVYLEEYFPNSTWVKVLSYIPFITSELMLACIALEHCLLVGDHIDNCFDVGVHLRLCYIFRACKSLRGLDVWATTRPWAN